MHSIKHIITKLISGMVILGLISCLSNHPATAQTTDVTMTIQPYLNGNVKYNEWLPMRVTLVNNGPGQETEVQAEAATSGGPTTYKLPVSLPTGARKEVTLYMPPSNFTRQITVRLIGEEKLLAEARADISTHPQSIYLVGALTPDADRLTIINAISLPRRDATRVIPLTLADIPERAESLRTLDCLIISNTDTTGLTPAQVDALHSWVMNGGRLVIGGGAGAERTLAGLTDMWPTAPIKLTELDSLDALATFANTPINIPGPFLAGLPATDANPSNAGGLITQAGHPLIIKKALGQGQLLYIALDPAASPFNAWSGTTAFWQKILEPGAVLSPMLPYDVSFRTMEAENMLNPLNNLPTLNLPSIGWLGLLLGFYILLVGPINYFVLRAWRRLAWAWFTIPLLTLLFSAGGIGLGYQLRGNDIVINQISIVPITTTEGPLMVRSYIGLVSPTRSNYDITLNTSALVSLLPNAPWWGSTQSYEGTNALYVQQGETTQVQDFDVGQWSLRGVVAETQLDVEHPPLEVIDLHFDDQSMRGTLKNNLDQPLENIAVLRGSRFARLGDWNAKETRTFEVPLEIAGDMFPMVLFDPNVQNRTTPPESKKMARVEIFNIYLQYKSNPQDASIYAWTDWSPIPVQIEDVREDHKQTTLIAQDLSVTFESGPVKLPAGQITAEITDMQGEAGPCGRLGTSQFYLGRGEITMDYKLPQSLYSVQPTTITVHVYPVTGPNDVSLNPDPAMLSSLPDLYAYDWTNETWVTLNNETPAFVRSIPNPGHFLHPLENSVRIRAERKESNGQCQQFDLGLEGQLP